MTATGVTALSIWDKMKGELVDIVERLDDRRDVMVWRFPRYQNEIKNGAKLVVRESQAAVFVNEGKVADVFAPGTHTLTTANLPILATLKGWKYGFESPFKAEVYFVDTRLFPGFKWGTQNPVIVRDPEFGPVRLRAFGTFAVRVVDPASFLRELAGVDPMFKTEEVADHLRNVVVGRITNALGSSGVPLVDLAGKLDSVGARLGDALTSELRASGVALEKFIVENVSLPPEVEQALDKRSQMGVVGDLGRYAQFQAANALEAAAKNPGGVAGAGVGVGAGIGLGAQMAHAMNSAAGGPPPLPGGAVAAVAVWIGAGGQSLGPFDAAGLAREAGAGRLGPDTLVWHEGLAAWTAAKSVPLAAAALPKSPPPLPA
jgi:membrane protease subunit (stomatin/prohibitin family)